MIDDHHHDNDEDHDLGDVEPTSQEEIDQMVDEIERKHGKVVISKTSGQQQEQKKDNDKGSKEKGGSKRPVLAYKYSKNRRISLHEAVIIAGKPTFIKYDPSTTKVVEVEKIEEEHRVIRPPYEEEYPYQPYEFENISELNSYLETAKQESVFSLYRRAKSIFRKYNNQDDHKLTLLAADTVWSYSQDKFATTHYDAIIGDNGSGKSTFGDTFEATGYRAVNLTDPNATNLFRILGTVEPGQCTIIADESDKIEESSEMMSILKSGYHRSKKVVRTNSNTWMQEYFFPYCFKIIIAERSPSKSKAKGVLERTFIIHTYEETPDYDIKEVLNAEGEGHDDNELEALLSELREFRKLMLVYRLLHFNDPVVNTDIGLKGRNKELCKPTLQLFVSSSSFSDSKDNIQSLTEIRDALQTFIDAKHKRKTTDAIETALYPIIVNAISECGKSVSVSNLWQSITQSIDGVSNTNTPHIYETLDYGPIYRNTFTNVICDKFGAIRDRRGKTRTLIFDIDKVHKTGAVYNGRESKIKLDLLEQHSVDSYDSNDNITEVLNHPNKETDVKNGGNEGESVNNIPNNKPNPVNSTSEDSQKDPSSSLELSALSCRHGQNLEEFSCYYCSGFQTDSEEEYMRHCAIKHPKKPFQPTKADLERHGLKPQGKSWEI